MTLVSLGSPYLVRSFPKVSAYLTTYSPVVTAEISAVKALFGEIEIGGICLSPSLESPTSGLDLPCRAARTRATNLPAAVDRASPGRKR